MELTYSINEILTTKKPIILTTHENPDADGIGSELALYEFLKHHNKNVIILNSDHSSEFSFLDKNHKIKLISYNITIPKEFLLVPVDCNSITRIGKLQNLIKHKSYDTFFIDHHILSEEEKINGIIDPKSTSTGEIIFKILKYHKFPINKDIAYYIYSAILFDTGNFKYIEGKFEVLQIGYELLKTGISHEEIYRHLFENKPKEYLELYKIAINNIRIDNHIAWITLTKDVFKKINTSYRYTNGIVNFPFVCKDIKLSILFREEENGIYINLRSRGDIDVSKIAREFGGGGLKNAAGIRSNLSLNAIKDKILSKCKNLFY
jgi:phosphoesterase RecJ-like protein